MIQEQLFTALATVADGRVFPNVAPNNVARPYVVYTRVASTPENTLADGAPVENTRFQIDCFASTYASAVSLSESVKSAMKASSLTNLLLLEQDQFEPDALLHRVILDFSVWHY